MVPSVPSYRQKTLGICGMAQTRVPCGGSTAAPSLTNATDEDSYARVCVFHSEWSIECELAL
jgi:hypothetical protein